MSLLYSFKPHKDKYLAPIAKRLGSAGISANDVTAFGVCLAFGSGLLAYWGHLYLGLALFITSAMCDAFDGSLARTSNTRTEFGLYFDGIADRFSELFLVVGAVLGADIPASAFAVVAGSFVLLFARAYGHAQRSGPISTTFGRPERLLLLVGGILCPAPLNTLLFVTAGLCCVFSSAQIVAQRTAPKGYE